MLAAIVLAIALNSERAGAVEPPIVDLVLTADGKSLLTVGQAGVQQYAYPSLDLRRTVAADSPNLHCAAFSPDQTMFAVGGGEPSQSGAVELFHWPSMKPAMRIRQHHDSVRDLVWLDDSNLVSAGLDRQILKCLIDQDGKVSVRMNQHSRAVHALCLLENILVSAGEDRSVRVWDCDTGQQQRNLNQHTGPVVALAKPMRSHLADRHSDAGADAGKSPSLVASASLDRSIRFWQPGIGRMVRYIRLDAQPTCLAWLDDGRHLVAGCVDGGIRIIDAANVRVIETVPVIDGWVYCVVASTVDSAIVVGGSDAALHRIQLGDDFKTTMGKRD
ncbi:hypothetical protein LOC67_08410 [Stieleria sp. JC731]|uniref:WD40 repeat domain-containing protein n=1 Tax=Pirellulaceae TaxID=2691357 RepID=UPI001E3BDB97|nr:hypothetical protein [Stieleria sp. JC731]MCC9600581.1 hypothetical protein [Stieleria sp. JC731]